MNDFLEFLHQAPTSWHAAHAICTRFTQAGFHRLNEGEPWKLEPGKSYFVTRDDALVAAFQIPKKPLKNARILASHLDSPALKLKPHPQSSSSSGIERLTTEVYGVPILSSWLDRDLAIAGRVTMFDARDRLQSHLVHLKDFPIIIPQLAVHLDRAAQETGVKINKQDHLQAIAAIQPTPELIKSLLKKEFRFEEIASYDLFLVPLEAPRRLGGAGEMVASYRLDNLTSAYASLIALTNASAPDETLQMAIFWDHEEVGSNTATGAGSPFLDQLIERICLQLDVDREGFLQLKSRSLCISVDLAHGFHPSYSDKYDPSHAPLLGKGVVLKQNANQRYATSAESAGCVMQTARKKKIALQSFVSRSDIPSGSTVGPIMAARCGINCVDLGIAGWAMHSAREVVSWHDEETLCHLLEALLEPL